ncbi:DUF262 domain-containing protein [Micromonospora sp. NPDC049101]|uniref:DUF262 domain-containing protein n=1 Tax=Micromonospora sp. NPDC049101 TaxID=3155032 RepID=UPI0033E9231F
MASPAEDEWDDQVEESKSVTPEEVARAVVTGTDWTTETILSQLRRGNIQLNPRFQRRDAWDATRKSRFIESLLLNLPIPQLVLAEDRTRRGAFVVLDGKQRLLSIRQFAVGSSVDNDGQDYERLRLRGIETRSDLAGASLASLEQDEQKLDDLNAFLNQTIRTVVVRNWPNEAFLHDVFLRLNTGSVSLSPQELRQALHPGPFTDFVDDYSANSIQIRKALNLKKPDFRMRDVEVALRFFAFNLFWSDYRGELKDFLDDTTGRLNAEWETGGRESQVTELAEACDTAIETTFSIFGKNAFRRWTGKSYISTFNRAVFDVMTFYFKLPKVRERVIGREADVEDAFKALCGDPAFTNAIQTTTKTIAATQLRLLMWGEALKTVVGSEVVQSAKQE